MTTTVSDTYKKLEATGNIEFADDLLSMKGRYGWDICHDIPRNMLFGLINKAHNISEDVVMHYLENVQYTIDIMDLMRNELELNLMCRLGELDITADRFLAGDFSELHTHELELVLKKLGERESIRCFWALVFTDIIDYSEAEDDILNAVARCCMKLESGSVDLERSILELIDDSAQYMEEPSMKLFQRVINKFGYGQEEK